MSDPEIPNEMNYTPGDMSFPERITGRALGLLKKRRFGCLGMSRSALDGSPTRTACPLFRNTSHGNERASAVNGDNHQQVPHRQSPATRLVGWNPPSASTSHSPVPPAPTGQSRGSTRAPAWSQLCQHIPSPTVGGRNHAVPKSSGWKDTRSLSRRMEKMQLYLPSANSSPSFSHETTSANAMKNGEKTSSVVTRQTAEISTCTKHSHSSP